LITEKLSVRTLILPGRSATLTRIRYTSCTPLSWALAIRNSRRDSNENVFSAGSFIQLTHSLHGSWNTLIIRNLLMQKQFMRDLI